MTVLSAQCIATYIFMSGNKEDKGEEWSKVWVCVSLYCCLCSNTSLRTFTFVFVTCAYVQPLFVRSSPVWCWAPQWNLYPSDTRDKSRQPLVTQCTELCDSVWHCGARTRPVIRSRRCCTGRGEEIDDTVEPLSRSQSPSVASSLPSSVRTSGTLSIYELTDIWFGCWSSFRFHCMGSVTKMNGRSYSISDIEILQPMVPMDLVICV